MLHGTSAESVAILFERGILLPGRPDYVKSPSELWYSDVHKDRLYFNPVKSRFRNTSLYSRLKRGCTRGTAIRDSKIYARFSAVEECLRKTWELEGMIKGRSSDWISTLGQEKSVGSWDDDEIRSMLKDFKMGLYDLERARADLNEFVKRRGVVVEVDKRIFQFKCGTVDRWGDDIVWAYLPDGLPIKYVVAVHPLSRVDNNLLKPYFRE